MNDYINTITTTSEVHNYYEQGYRQGKADGIEEYNIALHIQYEDNKDYAYSVWDEDIYKYEALVNLNLEEIDKIAKKLKEGNNE